MPRFTISSTPYEIDAEDVQQAVKGKASKYIRKYSVEIAGQRYLIKQVLAIVCNLPPISFTSMDAYRVLHKLGFEIHATSA